MEYEPLSKIYYKDRNQYESAYKERFNSNEAVRLDFHIGARQAFFLQTPELLRAIIQIQRIDKQVHHISGQLPPVALAQFRNRCLIDEIVLTNSIEGVHSTRREIGALLNDLQAGDKRHRFYGLVKKYTMLSQKQELPLRTGEDIREIYDELVLAEIRGEDPLNVPDGDIFRKGSVSVISASQKEIHRGLCPEAAIIAAMEKALAILYDQRIEPLFRTAIFHYLFGYIHPFYEGNGRTSRFVSSYLLVQEFEPLLGYRISYTIKENINAYYAAFKDCNDEKNKGDLTPFLVMFVDIVNKSVNQLHEALEKRQTKLEYYQSRIPDLPGSTSKPLHELYFILIQAALFADEGISTKELLQGFGVSRTSLMKRLGVIDKAGLLIGNRRGKEKVYLLDLKKLDQR